MKIKFEDLREYYKSVITDQTQLNRKNCPNPEELRDCIQGRASRKKNTHLVEHLSRCRFCAQEFQFILETQRQERKLTQDLGRLLGPEIGTNRKNRFLSRNWLIAWKTALAAAGVFLIFAVCLTLYFSSRDGRNLRGVKIDQIKLIQPAHKKTTEIPITFRWSGNKNVKYYILELFDKTLYPIWKSPHIHTNRIKLPEDVTDKLSLGETYFWFVTGFIPPDRRVESSLENFQIKQ
ncbi:MAG: hypothetical protein PVI11_00900 [Candidatus Aminicenantes bacterium]|jgi:hypothetical protein